MIPSYNVADFLEEAVTSVRAQTYPVAEIIVVDDASTDGSADIASRLGVTTLVQPENAGPSAARNRGVEAASGDLVSFLDADDAWLPTHLADSVAVLRRFPALAVVSTARVLWDGSAPERRIDGALEMPGDPVVTLLERNIVDQTCATVRRSAIVEAGGYDEARRWAEDYDLWLKIAARHAVARLWIAGGRYRSRPGQLSRARLRMVQHGFEVRLKHLAALRDAGDAARAACGTAAVVRALDAELHSMWYLDDAPAFEYVLGVAAGLPGAEPVYRRWALRRRVGWHLWQMLRRVKRRIRPPHDAADLVA